MSATTTPAEEAQQNETLGGRAGSAGASRKMQPRVLRQCLCVAHRQLLSGALREPGEAATVVVAILIPVAEAHRVPVETLDVLELEEAREWFGQDQVAPRLSRLALRSRLLRCHRFLRRRRSSRPWYTRRRTWGHQRARALAHSHVMPGMQEEVAAKIDAGLRKALKGRRRVYHGREERRRRRKRWQRSKRERSARRLRRGATWSWPNHSRASSSSRTSSVSTGTRCASATGMSIATTTVAASPGSRRAPLRSCRCATHRHCRSTRGCIFRDAPALPARPPNVSFCCASSAGVVVADMLLGALLRRASRSPTAA